MSDKLLVGGHEFSNPNGWTEEQAQSFYMEFLQPLVMAGNIKWMGLSQFMKNHTYEEALASQRKR